MVHCWSTRERGVTVAAWNVAHDVGAGPVANVFVYLVRYGVVDCGLNRHGPLWIDIAALIAIGCQQGSSSLRQDSLVLDLT